MTLYSSGRVLWVYALPSISYAASPGMSTFHALLLGDIQRTFQTHRSMGVVGFWSSVSMTGMAHKGWPDFVWYLAFAAFWVAIVSRNGILQPRYYHSDLLLGAHDLGTLAFTPPLAKGDCSSSMRASDRHA
jgi:hypothetical protein